MNYFSNAFLSLRQWWDADYVPPGAEPGADTGEDCFDFSRFVPYLFLHAGCLLVLWVGWSWFAVATAVGLYQVRMFAITAFYHRYFSHRAFHTSRGWQFVFAVIANTSMQRGPLWWASTHRHHHHHSDQETDKHSPVQRGFLWSHIGWLTSRKNFPTDYRKVKDFAAYPELVYLNRHDFLVPILFGAALWLFGWALQTWAPALGTNGPQLFVWGFFISTVVLLHGTLFINSLAHMAGSRRFHTTDDSRNNFWLALLTLGEGWHNNHHRFSHCARQGFYWYEVDCTWYILKIMARLGLIWDLRGVPAHIYEEARTQTLNQKA
ncbi:MAG: acyl-CoA desaturase [Verrucomicrobiae bacterium]|nr:acyl-CoA desaturase [Verrucomicrobiae bacterium]